MSYPSITKASVKIRGLWNISNPEASPITCLPDQAGSIFADFQIGYSNGTLLNTIPDEGDILDALKQIGILNDKGHEMFYGSVVFPVFDENKDCETDRKGDGSIYFIQRANRSKKQ